MSQEYFGIHCAHGDYEGVMLRGHKVGPFTTLAEAEKSAKKKNRIAKEKGMSMVFTAVPVDVNPWGQPIAKGEGDRSSQAAASTCITAQDASSTARTFAHHTRLHRQSDQAPLDGGISRHTIYPMTTRCECEVCGREIGPNDDRGVIGGTLVCGNDSCYWKAERAVAAAMDARQTVRAYLESKGRV